MLRAIFARGGAGWGGDLAWFVFWGYQLFILLAATGYLLGATQPREYAALPGGAQTQAESPRRNQPES